MQSNFSNTSSLVARLAEVHALVILCALCQHAFAHECALHALFIVSSMAKLNLYPKKVVRLPEKVKLQVNKWATLI
jgi:hypothetical protein